MMELKDYQEVCKKTSKKDFNSKAEEIMTWGLGISGEAGDVAGCIENLEFSKKNFDIISFGNVNQSKFSIKKTFVHDKDVREGIRENLGDVLWYIGSICNFFDWSMQDILEENVAKLKQRFPEGFTKENANRERIDWGEK